MAAGIQYSMTPLEVERELCNQATIYRLAGGVNLEDANLVAGSFLPHLAPLAVNLATRKAVAVKNVKVVEAALANATAIKVEKNSLAFVGMFIGNGTVAKAVTAINTTNAAYDTLTVSLTAAVAVGDVLFQTVDGSGTTPKNVANFLNYARCKVETGATVTLIGQAYEIKEKSLYLPVNSLDKAALTSRFMFV